VDVGFIPALGRSCYPPAIARVVAIAVVDPVDLKTASEPGLLRPLAEDQEVAPFRANKNPARSVQMEIPMIRIGCPLNHPGPDAVEARSARPAGLPVTRFLSKGISFEATAGSGISSELRLANDSLRAALTNAIEDRQIVRRPLGHSDFSAWSSKDLPSPHLIANAECHLFSPVITQTVTGA
jgi:hypothetical protein